jgi:hypothetical protein
MWATCSTGVGRSLDDFTLDRSVDAFRELLVTSWPIVKRACPEDKTGSFLDDWLQANWERVVEACLQPSMDVVLEVYGSGADCSISSSRVWQPQRLPTTPVYIRYLGNEPLVNLVDGSQLTGPLVLYQFCTMQDGWPVPMFLLITYL